jgi:hypothetical protein
VRGFSLNKLSAKNIAQRTQGSAADTLARFGESITSMKHPQGPIDTWIGETIVHCEDIRRALKIEHDYLTDALVRVADFYRDRIS